MRYHYVKPKNPSCLYGELYFCNHPVYNRCTLYLIGTKGLAVIQQRYNRENKHTWWGEIDSELTDAIYLNPNFKRYFDERADICKNGIYPTVAVRQIMWALKLKPLPKECWETVFDRRYV